MSLFDQISEGDGKSVKALSRRWVGGKTTQGVIFAASFGSEGWF